MRTNLIHLGPLRAAALPTHLDSVHGALCDSILQTSTYGDSQTHQMTYDITQSHDFRVEPRASGWKLRLLAAQHAPMPDCATDLGPATPGGTRAVPSPLPSPPLRWP